jgi:hypothetical protein
MQKRFAWSVRQFRIFHDHADLTPVVVRLYDWGVFKHEEATLYQAATNSCRGFSVFRAFFRGIAMDASDTSKYLRSTGWANEVAAKERRFG